MHLLAIFAWRPKRRDLGYSKWDRVSIRGMGELSAWLLSQASERHLI